MLYNIAQYCTILHNIAQYCTILQNIAQYCNGLQLLAVFCNILYFSNNIAICCFLARSCIFLLSRCKWRTDTLPLESTNARQLTLKKASRRQCHLEVRFVRRSASAAAQLPASRADASPRSVSERSENIKMRLSRRRRDLND